MYPAVHVIPLSLPATERLVPNGMWYQRSERTAISSLSAVQRLFLLVSVSFICSCACVAFLCRSSVCACVRFILFVFRQQKIVQRMQEIVAKLRIVCGRCSLFRDYRTDVGYYVQTVHRVGCSSRAFFVTTYGALQY